MCYCILRSTHKMIVTDYNSTLNTLEQWAADWKKSFNLQKSKFIRITNKKHSILAPQYTLQSKTIKEVTHAKYLGVTIDKNLSALNKLLK